MKNCKAIQQSDEMFCAECDLRWDTNDADPPSCRSVRQIIGITGAAGSGKSTMADYLVSCGFVRLKFAGPLKAMTRALLTEIGYTERSCDRAIEGDAKDKVMPLMPGLTPRFIMQTLGTEWGRDTVRDTFWTDLMRVRLASLPSDTNVVIDDVRFENEAELVRSFGGRVLRITGRGGIESSHSSERVVTPDMVYHNTLTVQQMRLWLDYTVL